MQTQLPIVPDSWSKRVPVALAGGSVPLPDWAWLLALTLMSATGLLLVSVAYHSSRISTSGASMAFWAGLLLFLLPSIMRLATNQGSRNEQIGTLLLLGISFYAIKVLYSPDIFTWGDELQHWRTTNDLLMSGRLFTPNPILPVSPFYPGLEIITSALVSIGGLTIFQAGMLVIGVARVVLIIALYLFAEQISSSQRVATLCVLIYMMNPHFAFFDAQFGYESLALAFAVLALFVIASRQTAVAHVHALTLVAVLCLTAVIVTHHVTSYAVVVFLIVWSGVTQYKRYLQPGQHITLGLALLTLAGSLGWLLFVATPAISYLTLPVRDGLQQARQLMAGTRPARLPFSGGTTQVGVQWVKLLGFASVGCILAGLPLGLYAIWHDYRRNATALLLAACALAYPAIQPLRLTQFGLTIVQRSSPFVFVGLSFVLAAGSAVVLEHRTMRWSRWLWVGWVAVIFVGTIAADLDAWHLPGAYLANVYTREIDPEGISMATWSRMMLGSNNRFGADQNQSLLLGSYGQQRPVTEEADHVWLTPSILQVDHFGATEQQTLVHAQIHYFVADRRAGGAFVLPDDVGPLDRSSIRTQLDSTGQVSRVFDSGNIAIYDVGFLNSAP